METIRTIYTGELRTEALHVKSGQKLITDAPTDNHGKGEAFSPTDLLATSLGCCMLTTMGIAAQTHGINIDGSSIKVTKIMASNPRRVSEIVVEFTMTGQVLSEKQKTILENTARTCPVAISLHPDLVQTISFNYIG